MSDPFTFFDRAFRKMDEAFADMDKGFAATPSIMTPDPAADERGREQMRAARLLFADELEAAGFRRRAIMMRTGLELPVKEHAAVRAICRAMNGDHDR